MTAHFVSDVHFRHHNSIKYCNRNFVNKEMRSALLEKFGPDPDITNADYKKDFNEIKKIEVAAMNTAIFNQWNKQVGPNDDVFHLGDFCFGGQSEIEHHLSLLNGRKHFIIGNHDDRKHWSKIDKEKYNIAWVRDMAHVKVEGQSIELCHFPMLVWNRGHHGVWHLHGHCHGTLPELPGKRLDVGIDHAANVLGEFRLFSFEDVKAILDNKEIHFLDHHNGDTN